MISITVIIVSYNTKKLLKNCVESIQKHEPNLPIIIIDGSDEKNDCFEYSKSLQSDLITVENLKKNIGHGKGIKRAASLVKTDFMLLLDTDTIILDTFHRALDSTWQLLPDKYLCYGVGNVVSVNKKGMNVDANDKDSIQYLHPYFALINMAAYHKYSPPIHHGAPLIRTMIEINKHKIHFLLNVVLDSIVQHLCKGTRKLNPEGFNTSKWDRI